MAQGRRRMPGFTLWELLIVLAIAAVLAALAAPTFATVVREARMSSAANQLLGALHFARSEAILRGVPTVVCLTGPSGECLEHAGDSAHGWLVFHDVVRGSRVRQDDADIPLRRVELPELVRVSGTRSAVTYWPVSRAGTTGTFRLCHLRGAARERAVVVSRNGRPRVELAAEGTECGG